ncbi:MAG: hypothetical protein HC816_21790 [Leptolyngbyaceae cyanobacterium RM1_1_2]|nr:hypothetical protein [Leptolyngbyaceae cyanobacterium RM1_1_2]
MPISNPDYSLAINQPNTPGNKGDLYVHDGSAIVPLPAGEGGELLTLDPQQALGIKWAAPPSPAAGGGTQFYQAMMFLSSDFTQSSGNQKIPVNAFYPGSKVEMGGDLSLGRFTPTLEGLYICSGTRNRPYKGDTDGSSFILSKQSNETKVYRGTRYIGLGHAIVSPPIPLNGEGDYVEFWSYQASSGIARGVSDFGDGGE